MSTRKQQQKIGWRRSQVLELRSKAHSQSEIATILHLDKSIICRDISLLRQHAKSNIRRRKNNYYNKYSLLNIRSINVLRINL
jgi:transcriptional regulator